jgi:hypothetical protein
MQPMTPPPEQVSVSLPVGQAIERVKRMLFQPFDLGKWITIGFCAWLAYLGRGGFHGGYNFSSPHSGGAAAVREWVEQTRHYVAQNLIWIVPLAAILVLVGVAVWVLLLWLSSRGRFMFLHCVALDKAEVAVPWRKFAREANGLFWFRLGLGLLGLAGTLPLVAVMALAGWRVLDRGELSVGGIMELAGIGLMLALVAVVFWILGKLTTDFVVPIMFRRGAMCLPSWGVLLGLLAANPGRFLVYFIFQIILALAIFVLVLTAVLLTCCILGCLLMIPFLGTVLLLPILVFKRSYSLYYLAQYGEQFDVFRLQ